MSWLGETIQTLSIAITAYFAVVGLRAWRVQLIGKRRFEIAEEAVLAAHRVKAALDHIRSPLSMSTESEERTRGLDESPEQTAKYDTYYVTFAREKKATEDFAQLAKSRLLCRVHFGQDAAKPFDQLWAVRAKVLATGMAAMRLVRQRAFSYPDWNKIEDVLWGSGENDPIEAIIDQAVADIEALCLPFLSPPDDFAVWRNLCERLKAACKRLP